MPYYRFTIRTPLSPELALARIATLLRPPPDWYTQWREGFTRRPPDAPPFLGHVQGNEFRLQRDIRYRNSFLPRLHGRVLPAAQGAEVCIELRLHPLTAVFMGIWLSIAAGFLLLALSGPDADGIRFVLGGLFGFGILLVGLGFYPEAFKARRLLEQALQAAHERRPGPR